MRKPLMGLVSLTMIVSVAIVMAVAGSAPPDSVVLSGCGEKKAPVDFPHADHVDRGIACTDCHHTNEGLTADSGTEVEKCSSCHFEPEEGTPDCSSMSPKSNPYHANCIGCHKKEAAGPTKCNDCHPKE